MPKNEEDDPVTPRLLVIFLRSYAGLKQTELAEVSGVGQALISRYESGKGGPSEETLRRITAAVGIPWPVARALSRCFSAVIRRTEQRWEDQGLDDPGMMEALVEPALMAVFPYIVEELTAVPEPPSPEEQRREAGEIWENLQSYPSSRRRRLIELAQGAYPDWALAERICEASFETAGGAPDQARELADLALAIAGTMEDAGRRSRMEGYCWAHLAHARRAANDPAGAKEASARAWSLWQAGAEGDPGLLQEWRVAALAGGR
ncbi:MAG: helix-turn-helix domain-containing protein [Thermoanaerobaculia bacterium]